MVKETKVRASLGGGAIFEPGGTQVNREPQGAAFAPGGRVPISELNSASSAFRARKSLQQGYTRNNENTNVDV